MKRVVSACLEQTIRFDTSMEADPQEDFKHYLSGLDKKHIKYQILDSRNDSDGSLIIKIKKEYQQYSTEGYL